MLKRLATRYARLTEREKIILAVTMLVIGGVLVDKFVTGPVYDSMMALEQNIQDEQIAIKKSLNILLRRDQIAVESKQFADFSVIGKNHEEEVTSLLKDMEIMADQSAVSLLYVRPGNWKQETGVTKYYASLECEAEMEDIAAFFHRIENSTKLLQIDRYEIQPKAKESSIARCTMTLSKTVLSA